MVVDALYRLLSFRYGFYHPPGLTTAAYKKIACSSGQPWMETILIGQFSSLWVRILVLTPSWTDCQTYLPFSDEVTRSVRSSSQDLYA